MEAIVCPSTVVVDPFGDQVCVVTAKRQHYSTEVIEADVAGIATIEASEQHLYIIACEVQEAEVAHNGISELCL